MTELATSDVAPGQTAGQAPGRSRRLGPMAWTVADQLVSSGTNAAVSFLVARQVGAWEFGSFAVAFIAFAFTMGTSRALVTDPLMIRFSGAEGRIRRRAVESATGAALVVGAAAGVLVAGLGLVLGGLSGSVLIVLAFLLPGLLLQDAWRQSFFAAKRPQAALVNDLVWAGLQIGGMLLVSRSGHGGVLQLLLVWGAAAAIASALGWRQAKAIPRPRRGLYWLTDHRDLGVKLGLDFVINQGAVYAAVIFVGGILGLNAVGAIRGAQVLVAPVYVGFFALASFALPMLSRRAVVGAPVIRGAVLVSLAAGGFASAWVLALMLIPRWVGVELLGDTWLGARTMLPFTGIQCAAIGFAVGASLGLKALAKASTVLRLTFIQAPLLLGLGIAGAVQYGGRGAVAGFAVAQVVGAIANWWALTRGRPREVVAATAAPARIGEAVLVDAGARS